MPVRRLDKALNQIRTWYGLEEVNDAWPLNLTEDFSEVQSECRIRSSMLVEFGGKGER